MQFHPDFLNALGPAGPVVLLAEGGHPGHRGLPAMARDALVVAQIASADARDRMRRGDTALPVPFSHDGADDTAWLATSGLFAAVVYTATGPRLALHPRPAALLGADPAATILLVLSALGAVPPQPMWGLPDSVEAVDASMPDAEPVKAVAFSRAREVAGAVWLGLRTDAAGLRLAVAVDDRPAHDLLVTPDTAELRADDLGLSWRQDVAGEQRQMHVPWAAVWAVRSSDLRLGWCWPADMPAPMHAALAQARPQVWQHVHPLAGVPLPLPPAPPAVVVLTAPQQLGPAQAVAHCRRHGAGLVLVDAAGAGVQVPRGLEAQPVVAVPIGVGGIQTELEVDAEGLTATMPDGEGRPGLLRAPWSALLAVSSLAGFVKASWNWPDHATPALVARMRHDRPGHAAIALEQPFGARRPEGVPTLRVEYELQRTDLH